VPIQSDKERRAIFYQLSKRVKKTKQHYPTDKKDLNQYDMDLVMLNKVKPSDYLYLTQAQNGMDIFHKDDVDSLNHILHRIQKEEPLDAPILEINLAKKQIENHDGRHRALGTMLSGIKDLPVVEAGMVKKNKKDVFIPVKLMSKKELVLMHHPEKLKPQDGNFDYG
jgi:hypothetical protein